MFAEHYHLDFSQPPSLEENWEGTSYQPLLFFEDTFDYNGREVIFSLSMSMHTKENYGTVLLILAREALEALDGPYGQYEFLNEVLQEWDTSLKSSQERHPAYSALFETFSHKANILPAYIFGSKGSVGQPSTVERIPEADREGIESILRERDLNGYISWGAYLFSYQ